MSFLAGLGLSTLAWLMLGFVFLNALDMLTTWLGVFKLVPELRAVEANPMFKDVQHQIGPFILRKAVVVVLAFAMYTFLAKLTVVNGVFIFKWMDLVLCVTVLNNFLVYLLRRTLKRKILSPIGYIEKGLTKIKLPKVLAFFLIVLGIIIACYFLAEVL